MDINTIELFEKYLEVGVVLFCIIILLVVLFRRFFCSNDPFKKKALKQNNLKKFNDEITVQFVTQQFVKSFEKISEVINKQQSLLLEYINNNNKVIHLKQPAENIQENNYKKAGCSSFKPVDDPYCQIERLSDSGLDATLISKKVKRPKCEIDLVLNLKKLSHEKYLYASGDA